VVPSDFGDNREVRLQVLNKDVDWHAIPTGASVIDVVGICEDANKASISVPTISARTALTRADLVKLDVEGAEGLLLKDAEDEILASRPVILLECLPTTEALPNQLARLHSAGFTAVSPLTGQEQGTDQEKALRPSASAFVTRDTLLVPNEKLRLVRQLITGHGNGEFR